MNKRPWVMLGWLLVVQLAVAFVGRSLGPLAPFIEQSFHLTKTQVGFLPAALFVGQSLVSLPAGWYADKLGTRKMLLILSSMLGFFFFFVSMISSFWVALLGIVLGGLGYGAMHPTSNRGIVHWFPSTIAGTAMGIKQMGVTAGSALSALVLLPLANVIGWQLAMGASALLLLVLGSISFFFYRDLLVEKDPSQVAYSAFWPSFRALLGNKPLVIVSVAAMGLTGAQISLTTYLVFYVSDALLYPIVIAAVFLAISEVSGSAGRIVWGLVSDRLFHSERLPVLILIALVTAICGMAMAFLPVQISLLVLVPLVVLFGFCIAGFNGVWMNYASESVPRKYVGMASGFSLGIGSMGVIIGPPIFGATVDATGGYTVAWLFVSAVMVIVAGLLVWAKRSEKAENSKGAGAG